jgi:hypothetical protein
MRRSRPCNGQPRVFHLRRPCGITRTPATAVRNSAVIDPLTRVKRVTRYATFEEMLDAEGPDRVNPALSRLAVGRNTRSSS